MNRAALAGCRTQPLLSYLKALGVFRVLSEQLDARLEASWAGGWLVLHGIEEAEEAVAFLIGRYEPSPLLSPWNSRGGFRRDRRQSSEKVIADLERSTSPRLERYRQAVAATREVWRVAADLGLVVNETVPSRSKARFVELCRGSLPDDCLGWIDAAVVLTGSDDAVYPALLGGSGGNLGSGDLSANFVEQVLLLMGERTGRGAPSPLQVEAWARLALLDEGSPSLGEALVGQFDPGGAGGVNMPGREKIVNPWDLVLALEGAVLFAAGAARRMHDAAAAVPFTVAPTRVGYASTADGERVKAELWLPEWQRPMTLPELRHLLAEGRIQWGRQQARSGLDVALAAASLGADRSITRFHRYVVAERLGQSSLAVPAGTLHVDGGRSEREGVDLLRGLTNWVEDARRVTNVSAATRSSLRALDRAQFEFAVHGDRARLQRVVVAAAVLERAVSRSSKAVERTRVLQHLAADAWDRFLDDGSPEYAIARALASSRDRLSHDPKDRDTAHRRCSALALLVRPVELAGDRPGLVWSGGPTVPGLGERPLETVLADALVRRLVAGGQRGERAGRDDVDETPGVRVAFDFCVPAPAADVAAYLAGQVDERRIADLLAGLALLDWRSATFDHAGRRGQRLVVPDPLWCLSAPFLHARPLPS
ncbi:MAG: type I-U CRISPR-associated protein Csx17, partial [Actinomycetota bacterium]|nr:type I-U CRISPR-associated protein Csx17 [Actinomycetota bacterium]